MRMMRLLAVIVLVIARVVHADQTLTPVPGNIPAPDFSLQDTDGNLHRLSEYRGRPVIINFWATWCPPCREEIPSMNRAWHVLREEGVAMLAINVGEDEDTIFVFTADYPADFPLLLDRSGDIIGQWPVKGLPTTYVIAPDGSIAYRAIGGREWDDDDLLDVIRKLKE
ncbi:MAG: TlpA disulfide reductase family protein [Pseudomonadota bacterium]|nr:TlpA disulfide reductase family protein [Pseudomonadota bacterium]